MDLRENLPWRTPWPAPRGVRGIRVPSDSEVTVLTDQVNAFDAEIRTALRSTATILTIAVVVITLGVSLAKDVRDIGLLVFFPLLAIVATFHTQVAADVAVMAEVRDRLASVVNHKVKYPLLNVRLISDVRRFAMGTVAMNTAIGIACALAAAAALRYGWDRSTADPPVFGGKAYFWLMLALIVLPVAAVVLAIADIGVGRKAILRHLDDVFGCSTRPDHLAEMPHDACSDSPTLKAPDCPSYKQPQNPDLLSGTNASGGG
jgi:hypothetical protein